MRKLYSEQQLAALAKQSREVAGKRRADAAREMGVAQASIFRAEEKPQESLFKLRKRMIEAYSSFKVRGPAYWLDK